MNLSYNEANALFKEDKIPELASSTRDGLKFLGCVLLKFLKWAINIYLYIHRLD